MSGAGVRIITALAARLTALTQLAEPTQLTVLSLDHLTRESNIKNVLLSSRTHDIQIEHKINRQPSH